MNPLNALGVRELNYVPIHFARTAILSHNTEVAHDWVTLKLSGRFCIIDAPIINENNKLTSTAHIAFEQHEELTYFMLACPFARR